MPPAWRDWLSLARFVDLVERVGAGDGDDQDAFRSQPGDLAH
ncbi:hypothetical protein [Frankia tisae]|nr:hypothetical protein [Frankia tisae]